MGNGKEQYKSPLQLILFGSPGTGKSHKVDEVIAAGLEAKKNNSQIVKTVFHPEYTYGDFMGKLMPLTDEVGKVTYRYYPGHFMQALALALKYHYESPESPRNVLLVIDEINRGNSAAIFGTVFQLLDRNDEDGWSSYEVNISDMERVALLKGMGAVLETTQKNHEKKETWKLGDIELPGFPVNGQIKLPPNLSIVGTMNTSDESIYYMDSAFKRRWSWEYVPVKSKTDLDKVAIEDIESKWIDFVDKLNVFITSHHKSIRKVEDKQVGYYFLRPKDDKILNLDIQNKLMFFLWDTVFARSKEPLNTLFGDGTMLVTFGDFSNEEMAKKFIQKIADIDLKS